jgi:hypothetical protein
LQIFWTFKRTLQKLVVLINTNVRFWREEFTFCPKTVGHETEFWVSNNKYNQRKLPVTWWGERCWIASTRIKKVSICSEIKQLSAYTVLMPRFKYLKSYRTRTYVRTLLHWPPVQWTNLVKTFAKQFYFIHAAWIMQLVHNATVNWMFGTNCW